MALNKIPIISLGDDLLISFQGDVRDDQLTDLKSRLFDRISNRNPRAILLDASGLSTMDSFMARIMNELAEGARINGVETYLVGIQPEVAMTLVEMGLSIPSVQTERNVGDVLQELRASG